MDQLDYIVVQTGFDRETNEPRYQVARHIQGRRVFSVSLVIENSPTTLAKACAACEKLRRKPRCWECFEPIEDESAAISTTIMGLPRWIHRGCVDYGDMGDMG